MIKWIGLGLGGLIGTFGRYFLSLGIQRLMGVHFPFGTLFVNMLGCFISGFFFTLAEEKGVLDSQARLTLQIGFCGAFTTFSTFILEILTQLRDGQIFLGVTNLIATIIGGILLFILGTILAHQL
jgi:fluoride exporter